MNIYGIDKVRGGTYNKIELTKEEKDFYNVNYGWHVINVWIAVVTTIILNNVVK
jgi:hypothetical protein